MFFRFKRALRAFRDRRDPQELRDERFLNALDRLSEAHTAQVEAFSAALAAQSKTISDYLALFQTTAKGERWVMNEEEEIMAEREKFRDAGIPMNLTPVDQLRWVLDNSGK